MSISEMITSSEKPYGVNLIDVLNPHIFWIEPILSSSNDSEEHHIVQAGLINVFPTDIKPVEPICQVQRYSSTRWMPAGGRLLREIASTSQGVYFLPKHVMPENFSTIDNVQCIFGELFVIIDDEFQSVTKLLSERGALYKSTSRFLRYLKNGTVFLDFECDGLDIVIDRVLQYANNSYRKHLKTLEDKTGVRQLVNNYKNELEEYLQERGDPKDVKRVLRNMEEVYDKCIRVAEEEDTSSARLIKDKTPFQIKNNEDKHDEEKQTASGSTSKQNNEKYNMKLCYLPAGANITHQKRDTDKVQRYLEDVQRIRSSGTKTNDMKLNISNVTPNTSFDKSTDSIVSPEIMLFIKSIPVDPNVKKQSDEVMSQASIYDCEDIESSIISGRNPKTSASSNVSDSDDTLVKDKNSNKQNTNDLNSMFMKRKLAKKKSDKCSVLSMVSTSSKLKFFNGTFSKSPLKDDHACNDANDNNNSSSEANSVVSTTSVSQSRKMKFLNKSLKNENSFETNSVVSAASTISQNPRMKFIRKSLNTNCETPVINKEKLSNVNTTSTRESNINENINVPSSRRRFYQFTKKQLDNSENIVESKTVSKSTMSNGIPSPISCSTPGTSKSYVEASSSGNKYNVKEILQTSQSIRDSSNIMEDNEDTDSSLSSQTSSQLSISRSTSEKHDGKINENRTDSKNSNSADSFAPETSPSGNVEGPNEESVTADPECDPDLVQEDAEQSINSSNSYSNWNVTNMLRFGVDTLGIKSPFTNQRKSLSPEKQIPTTIGNDKRNKIDFYSAYADAFYGEFIEKITNLKVVVHNKNCEIPVPTRDLESTHFLSLILKNIKTLGVQIPSKLQSSVWPTAFGDRSTFVIGPVNSGRGLSVLAPVCNKLPKILLSDRPAGIGPVLMIVCPDIFAASKAYSTCKVLLKDCITIMGDEFKIIKMDDWSDSNNLYLMMKGVDVLITTSQCLYQLLNYDVSVINLNRLLYLVFEDLDILNEQFHDETKRIIDICQKVDEDQENQRVRIYATSQIWCEFFERLAKESYNPTVVVSAVQECLFYSKAQMNIALTVESRKLNRLENILKQATVMFRRIVIVCNDNEEVQSVNNLVKESFITFFADSETTIDELNDLRKLWKSHNLCTGSVVMTSVDENLQFIDVCDAHWLIHYSLPKTYARFNHRFTTMVENYPNLYITNEKFVQLKVDLFITEDDLVRLPKLSQFIKRYNIKIPENLQRILVKVIKNQDINKATTCVPLCERLSAFGYCSDTWSCIERHSLVKQDHPEEWLPKVGRIKCYVTAVHHASLFSARLLEHTDFSGKKHKVLQRHIVLLYELSSYYSIEGNRRYHGAVSCGDMCAVKVENDYKRCRVLRIIPIGNNRKSDIIRVNLIDEELYLDVKRYELFHLPDYLRTPKSTIVRVRLAGVLPSGDNHFWSTSAIGNVKSVLSTNDNMVIQGNIVLGIRNTLWLDDIQICQRLETLGVDIVKCNLKNNLISNGYAVTNTEHLIVLYDFCKTFHFQLPSFQNPRRKTVAKKIKFEPQWAHLNDSFTDVFFSYGETLNLFFIRHKAFSKILDDLENDLQDYVDKMKEKFISFENEITRESIKQGYYCIALFVDEGIYGRVQVLDIKDNASQSKLYECYFVDHGEKRIVRSDDMYPLTEEFVKRLPFQAIECRIFGVKPTGNSWNVLETDKLYDFSFIDDSKDLKVLVTKYYTKEKAECTKGHKYGVILIDCCMRMSFADYIIDVKLALPVSEEIKLIQQDYNDIEKLYLIQPVDVDEDEIDGVDTYDLNGVEWPEEDSDNIYDESRWDCEFYKEDYEKCLKKDHLPRICKNKSENTTAIGTEYEIPVRRDENVKKCIPFVNVENKIHRQTPRVLWHQTNKHVTIKVMLADVNIYECVIGRKTLYFETNLDYVHYKLDIELAACIKEEKSYHTTKGMCVFIRLIKFMPLQWDALTASNSMVNSKLIVYDPDFVFVEEDPESDSEEQRAKEAILGRIKEMNENEQVDSDEEECDDVKNLKLMELDPVNKEILKQMERQMKGNVEDNESDEYYDEFE